MSGNIPVSVHEKAIDLLILLIPLTIKAVHNGRSYQYRGSYPDLFTDLLKKNIERITNYPECY